VVVAPRSTWSHCGSLNALDQRLPALPSTAAPAGKAAFSTDEAVAGLPCAALAVPQAAASAGAEVAAATAEPVSRARTVTTMARI
jgi:hypothetical protein